MAPDKTRPVAGEQLSGKNNLNQIILDNMPCVALLVRPSTREIVASNQAARKFGALPGTKCFATLGQQETPCPWCLAPTLWETGEPQHMEVETSGIFWDAYWVPVGPELYMHYAFDITEHKLAERRLVEMEQTVRQRAVELQAVLDVVPAYVFFAHDTDCRYIASNATTYELMRLPIGSNVSKSAPAGERPETFRTMKHGREIPPPELPMQKAAATGEAVRDFEFDMVYADGSTRRLFGNTVPGRRWSAPGRSGRFC
jgi:PAS domain-containing protein